MLSLRPASSSAAVLLLFAAAVAFCLASSQLVAAKYSEKENVAFIERIIGQLNNRYECELPSYDEVDEMQKAFGELQEQYGADKFDSMLSDDMRLVLRTVLDQWTSFQERMSSTVVIRAAKRRSFMCKIEEYQLAKYNADSVCTRFKDTKSAVTDKIFEKNPIVRYIKHLETMEVIERPDEAETTTEKPETVGEAAGEPSSTEDDSLSKNDNNNNDNGDETNGESPAHEEESATTEAPQETVETSTVLYKDPSEGLKPGDHYIGADGQPKVFLGQFEMHHVDDETKEKKSLRFQLDQSLNYDPLQDMPVPKSTDGGDEKPKEENDQKEDEVEVEEEPTTTTTEAPMPTTEEEVTSTTEEPTTTTTTTTTEEPLFDKYGAPYVDIDEDDEDLARVVRLPAKDWEMDVVFGYFKWPDEGEQEPEPIHLDHSVRHAWNDFVTDPKAFDEYMYSLTTTTPRPKINGAEARRKKQEFFNSVQDENRRGSKFGWSFEDTPNRNEGKPGGSLQMPAIPKDRWVKLINNNVCRLGYNKDNIKRKAKGGMKAMKNWVKSFKGDEDPVEFDS